MSKYITVFVCFLAIALGAQGVVHAQDEMIKVLEYEDHYVISDNWQPENFIELYFDADEDLVGGWVIDESFGVNGYESLLTHIFNGVTKFHTMSRRHSVGLMLVDKNDAAESRMIIDVWRYEIGPKQVVDGTSDAILLGYSAEQATMLEKVILQRGTNPGVAVELLDYTNNSTWSTVGKGVELSGEADNFLKIYKVSSADSCCEYMSVLRHNKYVVFVRIEDFGLNEDVLTLAGQVVRSMLMDDYSTINYLPVIFK